MKFLTLFFSFYFVLTTFAQAQNGPNIQIPLQDNPAFTSKGRPAPFTVAIIDTGVDYNHPQLSHLIKLNPLEPNEIQDNDKNG